MKLSELEKKLRMLPHYDGCLSLDKNIDAEDCMYHIVRQNGIWKYFFYERGSISDEHCFKSENDVCEAFYEKIKLEIQEHQLAMQRLKKEEEVTKKMIEEHYDDYKNFFQEGLVDAEKYKQKMGDELRHFDVERSAYLIAKNRIFEKYKVFYKKELEI